VLATTLAALAPSISKPDRQTTWRTHSCVPRRDFLDAWALIKRWQASTRLSTRHGLFYGDRHSRARLACDAHNQRHLIAWRDPRRDHRIDLIESDESWRQA
jgi:hypothetical protein